MALIGCKNVSFAYEGKPAVEHLNFSVESGEYLCIVGENGSGKSTLVKGLLRLIKPYEGEVVLGEGLAPDEIGYLPQQSAAQKDFPASVYEVVLSGRLGKRGMRPFYSAEDKHAARENIEKLGISELSGRCYRELSGGQQQRVLLARALCATEKMILLDEPVAGLDPKVTLELYELINRINREFEITVLMVSHDIKTAAERADKILHLKNRQLFFGSADEYKSSEVGRSFMGGNF